jgi:hypothetical protein
VNILGVVGEAELHTHSRAERKAFVSFLDNVLVMIRDWWAVFAEGVIRWKWCFTFRELGIGIIMLQCVEKAMLIVCIRVVSLC